MQRYVIIKKIEKFFSGFITCWGRRNAFCDSHICLCLPCAKARLLLRHGRLPFVFGVKTKYGTYSFYCLKRFSCDFAFFMSYKAEEKWKRVEAQWEAVLNGASKGGLMNP